MMVPVFARPVLATPMRAFVPDMLPSLASSAQRAAYLNYVYFYNKCVYLNNNKGNFSQAQR